MASNRNFTNFRAVYDDLTGEVERSSEQFLPDHLENWFRLIDETPGVREIVRELERPIFLTFITWFQEVRKFDTSPLSDRSKARSNLTWPQGPDKRLGTQISVFRELAKRNETARNFGARFIRESSEAKAARDLIDHIFMPMARELRRRLEAALGDREDLAIPASDRTVNLNHNSEPYREAVEALDELERALTEANDYPDAEDKEQRIAEVSAARRLLKAARVRIGAVAVLLSSGIVYFTTQLTTTAVGKAASVVVDKIVALLGTIF
jgi:hypothetical protein